MTMTMKGHAPRIPPICAYACSRPDARCFSPKARVLDLACARAKTLYYQSPRSTHIQPTHLWSAKPRSQRFHPLPTMRRVIGRTKPDEPKPWTTSPVFGFVNDRMLKASLRSSRAGRSVRRREPSTLASANTAVSRGAPHTVVTRRVRRWSASASIVASKRILDARCRWA